MNTTPARPRSVEIIGDGFLAIVWDDGHESFYSGPELRTQCPCAECRVRQEREAGATGAKPGARFGSGLSLAMAPPRLMGFEEVGRYALRLLWSDGHSAGLYEHRLLRRLCPCEACAGTVRS